MVSRRLDNMEDAGMTTRCCDEAGVKRYIIYKIDSINSPGYSRMKVKRI